MAKRTITNGYYKLRYIVLERDNFTCQLCGQKAPNTKLEVDHIVPVSEGGTDDISNLRTTCYACNRGRGSFTVQTHKPIITAHNHKGNNLKGMSRQAFDEVLYQHILKWGSQRMFDLKHACTGRCEREITEALLRLHEQGLVYRVDYRDNEWDAVDRYSPEYRRRE